MKLQDYLTKCRVSDFNNSKDISFKHENFYSKNNTLRKSEAIFKDGNIDVEIIKLSTNEGNYT